MLNLEIAKLAKVSPATVSRVLNERPGVSDETVNHVRNIIAQKGIDLSKIKKKAIRNNSYLKHKTVAFLVLSEDIFQVYSSVSMQLVNGIQEALKEQGINMILAHVPDAESLPPAVLDAKVDGLILTGPQPDKDVLECIESIPSVWLSSHQNSGGSILLGGNEMIGEMAARYLLDRGHKKLAVVNAFSEHPGVKRRAEFFDLYAKSAGAESVEMFIGGNERSPINDLASFKVILGDLVERMLAADVKPTGLFVPIDMQVALLYEILYSKGVVPGKDVEIIGTDNDPVALAGLHPKPATVDIGASTLGSRVVRELLWSLEHSVKDSGKICMFVEPQLIVSE
ncbi:MAG: LacI family DNA-binding transcriptional regulator [Sedimentisphaeraceae bacterium JB056]